MPERIKKLILRHGGTDRAFAKAAGVSHTVVGLWMTGTVPHRTTIEKICHNLGVSPHWLATGEGPMDAAEPREGESVRVREDAPMNGRYVPLLSMAQAGAWDAGHSDEGYSYGGVFAMNVDDRRAFAITVAGNSMEPTVMEGDVVICSPATSLANGQIAVVRTRSDQAFIKFWRRKGEQVLLESANPAFKTLQFPMAEIAGAWPVVQKISSLLVKKG